MGRVHFEWVDRLHRIGRYMYMYICIYVSCKQLFFYSILPGSCEIINYPDVRYTRFNDSRIGEKTDEKEHRPSPRNASTQLSVKRFSFILGTSWFGRLYLCPRINGRFSNIPPQKIVLCTRTFHVFPTTYLYGGRISINHAHVSPTHVRVSDGSLALCALPRNYDVAMIYKTHTLTHTYIHINVYSVYLILNRKFRNTCRRSKINESNIIYSVNSTTIGNIKQIINF